jgi:plastocyanin
MKAFLGILVVALIAGGFFVLQKEADIENPSVKLPVATIYRTDEGFSPARVTIRKGESVAFTNSSKGETWPASNSHPLHDIYPEFDPRRPIKPGETWVFTFEREGDWAFHDHVRSNKTGIVTVIP